MLLLLWSLARIHFNSLNMQMNREYSLYECMIYLFWFSMESDTSMSIWFSSVGWNSGHYWWVKRMIKWIWTLHMILNVNGRGGCFVFVISEVGMSCNYVHWWAKLVFMAYLVWSFDRFDSLESRGTGTTIDKRNMKDVYFGDCLCQLETFEISRILILYNWKYVSCHPHYF